MSSIDINRINAVLARLDKYGYDKLYSQLGPMERWQLTEALRRLKTALINLEAVSQEELNQAIAFLSRSIPDPEFDRYPFLPKPKLEVNHDYQ